MEHDTARTDAQERLLRVRGTVQGVGFRPFVHRLAHSLGVRGWVLNDGEGVLVRAVAEETVLQEFECRLSTEAPPAARVEAVELIESRTAGELPSTGPAFEILDSRARPLDIHTAVPPDLALCPECRRELLDPADRREGYAFINCTQCGPRYSIIASLPYDRPRTSMARFPMCVSCKSEYNDPANRRHHAEPNACPACGPRLQLLAPSGESLALGDQALRKAAAALETGSIIAIKGIGGFHFFCDAGNEAAVAELRKRKHRDEKPLAVMFPDEASLLRETVAGEAELALLRSPAAPIVLVRRRVRLSAEEGKPAVTDAAWHGDSGVTGAANDEAPACPSLLPANLAPGNPWLGALLPYAPLHVMLLRILARPLVATSANLSEEPLCTHEREALERLEGIADLLLCHDRDILRPVDDSVMRVDSEGAPLILRRARGLAPSPLRLPARLPDTLLCTGAHMKATVAVASGDQVVLSPHIGDLGNLATQQAWETCVAMLSQLCGGKASRVACDKHPGYVSTHFAERCGLPLFPVQHHLAHLLACLLEHRLPPENVLGVVWDGTGFGEDGSIWGGEFLLAREGTVSRFAHLRRFSLPGGDAASRDARRPLLALLHEENPAQARALGPQLGFTEAETDTLCAMLSRHLNSPRSSSMGRLFDAAAVLLGLGRHNSFEGQLPLGVEALGWSATGGAAAGTANAGRDCTASHPCHLPLRPAADSGCLEADWHGALLHLQGTAHEPALRALHFHEGLAGLVVEVARRAGADTVALSGGCFQNLLLLELTRAALRHEGFTVVSHRILPPGDGSIAAGQALGALLGLGTVLLPRKT